MDPIKIISAVICFGLGLACAVEGTVEGLSDLLLRREWPMPTGDLAFQWFFAGTFLLTSFLLLRLRV
jgi:hypothetical protein